jgi:DNA ligase-1
MSLLRCEYRDGAAHLPALNLWLDSRVPQSAPARVFVSHAHSDHVGAHDEVILSDATSRLMRARMGGERREHRLRWGEPAEFSHEGVSWRITLHPAGHILGSAMALVEAGGESLLYTGDFKLRRGLSAEACEPARAGTLIMETTYGRPNYVFPRTEEVLAGIVAFCRQALDNDETPVLLGYSLGKSQEILRGLADAGLGIALHPQVARLTRIYEEVGQTFPAFTVADGVNARGRVVICPPGTNLGQCLRGVGKTRKAALTGWAMNPGCQFLYRADAAFPLSDHAGYDDLLEMVRRVQPKEVLTLHGFAADFAADLRARGWSARALSEDEQLALPLAHERTTRKEARGPQAECDEPEGDGSFGEFARACVAIGETASKTEKVAILAKFLRGLRSEDLMAATWWFTGRAAWGAQGAPLQVGWSAIREAVGRVLPATTAEDFRRVYLKHSDTGETVRELFASADRQGRSLSVGTVAAALSRIGSARGATQKVRLLACLLAGFDPNEARYLVKTLTGDLRIGLKEGLVEDAIAEAFGTPGATVRRAHLLTGSIAETAMLCAEGTAGAVTVRPFRPIRVMLASPEPTAEAIWQRVEAWASAGAAREEEAGALEAVGTAAEEGTRLEEAFGSETRAAEAATTEAWVEEKYDGIRCQVHKTDERVALYSRDLKDITEAFPEIASAARRLPGSLILDGELVAMRGGRALPFAVLQRRLGRREADLFLEAEAPTRVVVFDLLWKDGVPWIDRPLRERRAELESVENWPDAFLLASVRRARSAEGVEEAFGDTRRKGNEGLMVKMPKSAYLPGRRGLAWLKLKKAGATLDCVVVGAEYGHGKRKNVLSDYTFAVRDEDTGELRVIGKAYSGLTDAEIETLTRHFLGATTRRRGRYHEVRPDVVLEIAFDRLQPSSRHDSGLAMRFPRILRIRQDKGAGEVDTLRTARRIAEEFQEREKAGPSDRRQGGGGGEPR